MTPWAYRAAELVLRECWRVEAGVGGESVRSFQLHGRPWRPSTSWMRLWTLSCPSPPLLPARLARATLLCSQRLLPPQHVPPPRFAVHEAAAGAVLLHGIGSPCTCVHVPLIVIARLSLQSWHLLLCLGTCCSETTSAAVLVIARLPLALFSRQALALSASMALAAHARAFLCQPTWIVIACWQR